MLRILCRDHKEWLGQLVSHAVDGDAMFFHCFQQRTLRFGGRAIDLVDQHHLREKRTAMEHKALLATIEDGIAENIGGQQITGKLDALKSESERARECLSERCLADARDVFD